MEKMNGEDKCEWDLRDTRSSNRKNKLLDTKNIHHMQKH